MDGKNIDRMKLLDRYTEALGNLEKNIRETKHAEELPRKRWGPGEHREDQSSGESFSESGSGGSSSCTDQPCAIESSTVKFKAFFFLFKGSKACIMPFLPVYYQQLGLVASQIGLLQSCSPFTQIPLMMAITCLADRLNLRKTLIVISLIGWIIGIGFIAVVPGPRQQPCDVVFNSLRAYVHNINISECTNITTNDHNYLDHFPQSDDVSTSASERTSPKHKSNQPLLYDTTPSPNPIDPFKTSTPLASTEHQQPGLLNISRDIIYAPLLKQSLPGTHRQVPTVPRVRSVSRIFSNFHYHRHHVPRRSLTTEDAVTLTEYNWLYNPVDLRRLFVILLLLSVFGSVFQGPVHALSNAVVLDSLYIKGNTVDYGYQKAFGPVGAAIGTLAMGSFLSTREHPTVLFGVEVPHTDYSVAFISFLSLMVLCIPLAFTFDGPRKPESTSAFSLKVLVQVICSAKYGSFLLASAWTGVASGLSASFLFWYIMSVGGSHIIMGVAGLAALGAETLTYFALPHLSRMFSHHTLMLSCLLLVVIRYFLYGIFRNPWWLVVPECFKGMSAAIVEYTLGTIFADETLVSYSCSLQGSFLLAYYAVGFGMGSILGGVVIDALGAVKSFFVVSLISLVLSALFLIIKSIRYGYEKLQD